MKNIFIAIFLICLSTFNSFAQEKKYCVINSGFKYIITLSEDGSNKATFNQYDNYGNLKKTTQGEWILRDEGVYGTSYVLTFVFTGINANLPRMKFTCEFDAYGKLQGLIDSQGRTWNLCR